MNDLVSRYVHQVGLYLSPREQSEVQAELQSLIQDQLEDRYGSDPTPAQIAAVLAELGDPRRMAASYAGEQYLIGPELYPHMMRVLRNGWLLVPLAVVLLNLFWAFASSHQTDLIGLFIGACASVIQVMFVFSGVVVLIFAIIQHADLELARTKETFDPLQLPPVDDPGRIDQFGVALGMAMGAFVVLVCLYFVAVGGLTLRFDLNNPGRVIPAPIGWMLLLALAGVAQIVVHLLVLRRQKWTMSALLIQTGLELIGCFCLYFAVFIPVVGYLLETAPGLASLPLFAQAPILLIGLMILITVVNATAQIIRLTRQPAG